MQKICIIKTKNFSFKIRRCPLAGK